MSMQAYLLTVYGIGISHPSFKVCFIGDTVSFETFFYAVQCEQSKETFAVRYML